VLIGVNGVRLDEGEAYTLDHAKGIASFTPDYVHADGAKVTAGFLFDVPVRFDTDRLTASIASFQAGEIPSIPIIEVKA
jgi:uncharacterized protein (TIGR02217 family)